MIESCDSDSDSDSDDGDDYPCYYSPAMIFASTEFAGQTPTYSARFYSYSLEFPSSFPISYVKKKKFFRLCLQVARAEEEEKHEEEEEKWSNFLTLVEISSRDNELDGRRVGVGVVGKDGNITSLIFDRLTWN